MNMTEGPIAKKLLRFAVPLMLASLVQQLYNTVDLIVIGRFVGSAGTVGVATGGDIANFLTMACSGFSAAGQIYISQLVGAKQTRKVKYTIGTLITFMILISLFFTVVTVVCTNLFLGWMNCPEEAFGQARGYMIVTALGMPFIFGYNAVCGVLRGMGESRKPLTFIVIAAVSNIIMDILLVVVIPMEAVGTAIATVAAQLGSCIAAFTYLYRNRERFDFGFKRDDFRMRKDILKILLKLGVPKAAENSFINLSVLFCNSMINSYGIVAAAVNSVGNKVIRFANILRAGFGDAGGTAIGQNMGAQKFDRVKKIVHLVFLFSFLVCGFNAILCVTIPRQIFGIFNGEPEVLAASVPFMRIQVITLLLSSLAGTAFALIGGTGNPTLSFAAGMLDGVILRIGISLTLVNLFDMAEMGFYYGNAFARLGPVIVGSLYYFTGAWKRHKLLKDEPVSQEPQEE